jgi:hypothetical protein
MISILNIALIYASTVLFAIKKILNIDKYFVCESNNKLVNNFIAFILERLSLINNNRYTYQGRIQDLWLGGRE